MVVYGSRKLYVMCCVPVTGCTARMLVRYLYAVVRQDNHCVSRMLRYTLIPLCLYTSAPNTPHNVCIPNAPNTTVIRPAQAGERLFTPLLTYRSLGGHSQPHQLRVVPHRSGRVLRPTRQDGLAHVGDFHSRRLRLYGKHALGIGL